MLHSTGEERQEAQSGYESRSRGPLKGRGNPRGAGVGALSTHALFSTLAPVVESRL